MKIVNCKLKIAKHKGFTLIELLIAMAIVGILTATAMVNFGKNEDRDVRQEKDRLTSFLREVQNKSLAAEKVSGRICGFGVHYDGDGSGNVQAYYINSSDLDANCSAVGNIYDSTKKLEKFIPSSGVSVTSFSYDIFFMSPTSDVYQASSAGGTKPSSDFSIGLTKGSGAASATITPGGIIK